MRKILLANLLFLLMTAPVFGSSGTGCSSTGSSSTTKPVTLTVRFRPGRPIKRFLPAHALGAGIDGHNRGVQDRQLTPANIQTMLSVGLKSLAYRLRTELAIDAWHWNPQGAWSDAAGKQGYWISNDTSDKSILLSYGYRLPRRGNTIDQGDNNGYSRLDDGDPDTFWKSNPYLDRFFTGEANNLHPQWIVVDLGTRQYVDAVRLHWGVPFATRYEVQFADFDDISDISLNPPGMWHTFQHGRFTAGNGGDVVLRLTDRPVRTRFIRILMTESAEACGGGDTDIRDHIGYAVREIYVGSTDARNNFNDLVQHSPRRETQTVIHVSSTDPWHSESDLDDDVEQPGFDRVFQSGLTNGLPMLVATGLLYDTPENAAAEIKYLKSRGYPVTRAELGEEPDGQYVTPEDYGALYLQFARAIHRVDPELQLGGPSFQEILPDATGRSMRLGNSAWLERFLKYLKRHDALSQYSFFSFEWYPFDDVCDSPAAQLAQATGMMDWALRDMRRRGLSRQIPWIISEYNYSPYASRAAIGMEGALLNADIVGRFLTLGGDQAFLYGYTPDEVSSDMKCTSGGDMLFSMDEEGNITHQFAAYFGARLLTQTWLGDPNALHELYPVSLRPRQHRGQSLLTAYAVRRPEGLWTLLIINKDSKRAYQVKIELENAATRRTLPLDSAADVYQFSGEQYELSADESNPYPIKSLPPMHRRLENSLATISLPSYSLTVIHARAR
jgi:F5/8 type C domain-containing protein